MTGSATVYGQRQFSERFIINWFEILHSLTKTLPIEQTLIRPSQQWLLFVGTAQTHCSHIWPPSQNPNTCESPLESGYMLLHTLKARGNVSYFHTIYGHKSIYSARCIVCLRYNKKIHSTKPYYIVTATGLCVSQSNFIWIFRAVDCNRYISWLYAHMITRLYDAFGYSPRERGPGGSGWSWMGYSAM